MAMEGHFESYPNGAPLILIGIPDSEEETVHAAIEIPNLSSHILHHGLHEPVEGLKTIPRAERPPVELVFWSSRAMVGLGFLMLALGLWSLLPSSPRTPHDRRVYHPFALCVG